MLKLSLINKYELFFLFYFWNLQRHAGAIFFLTYWLCKNINYMTFYFDTFQKISTYALFYILYFLTKNAFYTKKNLISVCFLPQTKEIIFFSDYRHISFWFLLLRSSVCNPYIIPRALFLLPNIQELDGKICRNAYQNDMTTSALYRNIFFFLFKHIITKCSSYI